jgi:hypothetical protein
MANSNFIVQNGLTVGPLTIDAATGSITTTGTLPASAAAAGTLTGATLAAGVTASSLTSVGTIAALSAGSITTSGALTVGGNFTVNGTTTTINATTLDVADINITMAKGATALAADGGGITVDGAGATLLWDNTNTSWKSNKSIIPSVNNSLNIGTASLVFATVYATTFSGVSTTAKYADLAENYQADKAYAAGTVVMFGGDQEVTVADADTTAIAGVVSTNPAHLMNGGLTGSGVVPIALQGRVPCNVIGPIVKGDMLVSAGYGFAKASKSPQCGQVIGKALQSVAFSGKAVIEVVVGRV